MKNISTATGPNQPPSVTEEETLQRKEAYLDIVDQVLQPGVLEETHSYAQGISFVVRCLRQHWHK